MKGTELSTNKKYVDTHTNDGNLFCWKANETISVDNMCYQLHKEKGLVAFQATTLDNKPRREEDRIGEKVIFKPELQIEETIREYRPFPSPDGSQVVFDLYLKNPTGNDGPPSDPCTSSTPMVPTTVRPIRPQNNGAHSR